MTRATSPALDALIGTTIHVLDHGFIRPVDYMGNDAAIVQAARVSYGAGTKTPSSDQGLISYLMKHRHSTPFEMCEIKFHVKLPIFVARQWIRHRTANVNEISGRYSVLEDICFGPEEWNRQSEDNKQGRASPLIEQYQLEAARLYDGSLRSAAQTYVRLLEMEASREQARMVLPLSTYTQWYWKSDLHNLFHFLKLRADSHAQAEIRAYANAMAGIVKAWVPMAWDAFEQHALYAKTLSHDQLDVLKDILWKGIGGHAPEYMDAVIGDRLSKRDSAELINLLEAPA